jgi:hypothetical protein
VHEREHHAQHHSLGGRVSTAQHACSADMHACDQ